MSRYRKAKSGETTCVQCRWSGIREVSGRLECRHHNDKAIWMVVAKGNTCEWANGWPVPNEHGVYIDSQADEVLNFVSTKGYAIADFRAVEVAPGEWYAASRSMFADQGGASPLSKHGEPFCSKQEAMDSIINPIKKQLNGFVGRDIPEAQKAVCLDLLNQIEQHQNQGKLF